MICACLCPPFAGSSDLLTKVLVCRSQFVLLIPKTQLPITIMFIVISAAQGPLEGPPALRILETALIRVSYSCRWIFVLRTQGKGIDPRYEVSVPFHLRWYFDRKHIESQRGPGDALGFLVVPSRPPRFLGFQG